METYIIHNRPKDTYSVRGYTELPMNDGGITDLYAFGSKEEAEDWLAGEFQKVQDLSRWPEGQFQIITTKKSWIEV